MKSSLCSLGLAISTLLFSSDILHAEARPACGERDSVVDRLADKFGETRQSIGLGANNAVVEVFASQDTGTWTITVTMPSGVTCLLASGQAFETMNEDLAHLLGSDV